MSSANRYEEYDPLAFMTFFRTQGSRDRSAIVVSILEELVLEYIPEGAHILDLCCGKGELAQGLLKKGYKVTGLDGSEAMLHQARENTLGGEFIVDDARLFKLPPTFHAVVSVRSLVHITSFEELTSVFHNVYAALLENGWFVFDLDLEERYQTIWEGSDGNFTDDSAWIYVNSYDPKEKIGRANYVLFQLINEKWHRSDKTLLEKPYPTAEVKSALEKVGFTEVSTYDAKHDFGADEAPGRICYVCRKPLGR